MKLTMGVVGVMVCWAASAAAAPAVGQIVTLRTSSTRSSPALVTKVNSGDNVNLTALLDMWSDWPDPVNVPPEHPAWLYLAVDKGTGVGQWQENTAGIGPQGPQGPAGATGATGPGGVVLSSFTPTLTIGGAAVQLDATHDAELTIVIRTDGAASLSGGFASEVQLLCDATATPTMFADAGGGGQGGTIVVGVNLTQRTYSSLRTRVPASWRCRLTQPTNTGSPTTTIVGQVARVLG